MNRYPKVIFIEREGSFVLPSYADVAIGPNKIVANRFRDRERNGAAELLAITKQKMTYKVWELRRVICFAAQYPTLAEAWDACEDYAWFCALADFHPQVRYFAKHTITRIHPVKGDTKVQALKKELGELLRVPWLNDKVTGAMPLSSSFPSFDEVAEKTKLTVGEVREAEHRALAKMYHYMRVVQEAQSEAEKEWLPPMWDRVKFLQRERKIEHSI